MLAPYVLPRLLARSWPDLLLQVPSDSFLLKGVYNPKAFIPHAALLRQAFAHCARFPTAASRRSLGRVSVPVWPVALSGRLPVVALVGRYPTNKLIGRGPILSQQVFPQNPMRRTVISGISPGFPELSQSQGQVAHVLLTRSPLIPTRKWFTVRLACVKHAASVRPEPGSNSPSRPSAARGRPEIGEPVDGVTEPHLPTGTKTDVVRLSALTSRPWKWPPALAFGSLFRFQEAPRPIGTRQKRRRCHTGTPTLSR